MAASGSRPRITDMCIIHTCIRLLESPCSSVRPFVRSSVRNKICRIIHTCRIVKDRGSQMHHTLMHHAHIRIKNICIIHTCIRVKEEHRYMHHTCMYQDQASWINASYICASQSRVSGKIYASYVHVS